MAAAIVWTRGYGLQDVARRSAIAWLAPATPAGAAEPVPRAGLWTRRDEAVAAGAGVARFAMARTVLLADAVPRASGRTRGRERVRAVGPIKAKVANAYAATEHVASTVAAARARAHHVSIAPYVVACRPKPRRVALADACYRAAAVSGAGGRAKVIDSQATRRTTKSSVASARAINALASIPASVVAVARMAARDGEGGRNQGRPTPHVDRRNRPPPKGL